MPSDVQQKKRDQFALGKFIARTGIEMFPCSFCERNGKQCIVAPSSTSRLRCSECARIGKKCDVEGIPVGDWDAVEREESRLESAEMVAADSLCRAQDQMNEALGRLERLRKQKQFLRKRAADMLRRGLKTLDELEDVEEKERLSREQPEEVTPPSYPWSNFSSSIELPGPLDPFWAEIGLAPLAANPAPQDAGGTSSQGPGS